MAKDYYIVVDGEKVPVSEEVYRAFKRPVWAEKKRRQREQENGTTPLSLDSLTEAGFDVPTGDALIDEIVEDKLLLDMLLKALAELTDDERGLIDALFFKEQAERDLAKETGIPRKTIAYRKMKVLDKLRKLIEKM